MISDYLACGAVNTFLNIPNLILNCRPMFLAEKNAPKNYKPLLASVKKMKKPVTQIIKKPLTMNYHQPKPANAYALV